MYLILALIAIAMAAGWVAQLIVGRSHGRTDWTEAQIAGFVGSFVGGLLASLIAGDGLDFRPTLRVSPGRSRASPRPSPRA